MVVIPCLSIGYSLFDCNHLLHIGTLIYQTSTVVEDVQCVAVLVILIYSVCWMSDDRLLNWSPKFKHNMHSSRLSLAQSLGTDAQCVHNQPFGHSRLSIPCDFILDLTTIPPCIGVSATTHSAVTPQR